MQLVTRLAACALPVLLAGASWAQEGASLNTRALAATCAACHGTDGRTGDGSAVPALAGMPRDYMRQQMTAFRDGTRAATVMHQLAKGLTPQQVETLAAYFSSLKR